jgi:hypothetical protein
MILRDACKIAVFPSAFALALATCAPSPAFALEDGGSSVEVTSSTSEVNDEETKADATPAGAGTEQVGADEAGTTGGTAEAGTVNDASGSADNDPTATEQAGSVNPETEAQSKADAVEVVRAGVTAAVRDFDPESSSAIIAVGLGVCAGATVGNCLSRGLDRWSGAPVVSHE